MTIKKKMSIDSPDTTIKVEFEPTDTAVEVYEKFNKVVAEAISSDSSFDKTAAFLAKIPGLILRATVGFLRFLDYFGLLPSFLTELSPFHGSLFLTSMGSLGIPPIYHHLYNFGNLPVFVSYGLKRKAVEIDKNGEIHTRKLVDMKIVTDERICDGYYYASAFKIVKRFLANPELLDEPVTEVLEDID